MRELSGVGFFTTLRIPSVAQRLGTLDLTLGLRVHMELEGVRHGAGVVLFVRSGALEVLEGFTYDDPWPAVPIIRSLTIDSGEAAI